MVQQDNPSSIKEEPYNVDVSQKLYEMILETSLEAIIVYDINQNRTIDWNEVAIDVIGDEQYLKNKSLQDLISADSDISNQQFLDNHMKKAASGKFTVFEGAAMRQDKTSLPVEIQMVELPNPTRNLLKVTIIDISDIQRTRLELQKLNKELTLSNQELEQFAYIASHDLQEPLRVIHGYTEILRSDYLETLDEEGKYIIGTIFKSVKRMQQLIDDILRFSRVGSKIDESSIDLNELLEDVITSLSSKIDETGATINYGKLPLIQGRYTEFKQVFQNLISNAIKFNNNNPVIDLDYTIKEERVDIAISDNGIGISEEYQDQVFIIFRRLHPSSDYEGTGLGLALCKKIIETYNGTIWIETQEVGSTFHIDLPYHEELNKD